MKRNSHQWLENVNRGWKFYWTNLRTSIILSFIALIILGVAFYLNYPDNTKKIGDYLFSFGYSMLLLGIFSVFYEVQTREGFRRILADINPNIESGVIVHPSHKDTISREDAIAKYLGHKDTARIRSSTADNYVKDREPAFTELSNKIVATSCHLKILLYLPIFQEGPVVVGQRGEPPITTIKSQEALVDCYRNIINLAPQRVAIKFFFSPLHVNFLMLGDNRMFSSLIPSKAGAGVSNPCFEIFPTSSNSLFFKFKEEFDEVFESEDPLVSLEFEHVEPLLRNCHGDLTKLKEEVAAIADLTLQECG